MQPEIAEVLDRLISESPNPSPALVRLRRIARDELLSIHPELRAALYAGVSLVAAGTGLLVKIHYREIGPITVALAIAAGFAICAAFVIRRAPAFSSGPVPSPTAAYDYLLLLGIVLLGSELLFLEAQFRFLGPNWEYHLLLYSLICLAAAYRYDSATVLSLALSSFAAWRGVSARLPIFSGDPGHRLRDNSLLCGALFVACGVATVRRRFKAHFEGVWIHLGLILVLGTLVANVFESGPGAWQAWEIILLVGASTGAFLAYRHRRSGYFAECVLAAYIGSLRMLADMFDDKSGWLILAASAVAVLVGLTKVHRRMRA